MKIGTIGTNFITDYILENIEKNYESIKVIKANTNWKEWIKTIGVLLNDESPYKILFRGEQYEFQVFQQNEILEVRYSNLLPKQNPLFVA